MKVLAVDVGGTNVKVLGTGQTESRKQPSGPTMTPGQMVSAVKRLAEGWDYDVVSLGYPGFGRHGQIEIEPHNWDRGWVGFDFERRRVPANFERCRMQALGTYQAALYSFWVGTGRFRACVSARRTDGTGHLSYNATFETMWERGLERLWKKESKTCRVESLA